MPNDRERGGLIGMKKPLMEAAPVTDRALERTVLPPEVTDPQIAPAPSQPVEQASPAGFAADPYRDRAVLDEPTKPATFHLPVTLIQRLRATCRLKNTTMVDFVRKAIQDALETQRPTEEEIRKLLGS